MSSPIGPSLPLNHGSQRHAPALTPGGVLRVLEHLYARTPAKYRSVLVSGVVNPAFFLFILGFGLGSLVDERQATGAVDAGRTLGTGSYLEFVGPGLLATSAVLWGIGQSLWPTSGMIRWDKTYLMAANTPVTKTELAVAHVLWIGIRYAAASVLFTLVLAMTGVITSWWGLLLPMAGFLTVESVVTCVCAHSVSAEGDSTFPLVVRLIGVPMFLFSGAFFPLSEVPGIVAFGARLLPGWHGVELCRRLATGNIEFLPVIGHTAYLVTVAGIGTALTVRAFNRVVGDGQ